MLKKGSGGVGGPRCRKKKPQEPSAFTIYAEMYAINVNISEIIINASLPLKRAPTAQVGHITSIVILV
jgi:hypothetical protein